MQSSSRVSHSKSHNKYHQDYLDTDEQTDQELSVKSKRQRHESKRERESYYDKRYFKSEDLE